MWNLKRCDKNELIYKTEANSQTYRMEFMVAKWGNWGEEIGSLGLRCMSVKFLSHVRLFATPWTIAYQAPLSMEFSRQEYWSGLPFPSAGDLPNPMI